MCWSNRCASKVSLQIRFVFFFFSAFATYGSNLQLEFIHLNWTNERASERITKKKIVITISEWSFRSRCTNKPILPYYFIFIWIGAHSLETNTMEMCNFIGRDNRQPAAAVNTRLALILSSNRKKFICTTIHNCEFDTKLWPISAIVQFFLSFCCVDIHIFLISAHARWTRLMGKFEDEIREREGMNRWRKMKC